MMDYPPAPPPPKGRYSPIGLTRTSTPMPPGILKNGEGGGGGQPTPPPSTSNPKRQRSASFKDNMVVDECDENRTVATVPDNVSDTASETSSNGSYNNQPPLLDFMGSVCVASAWFTTCFPCAVVDINDADDRVVRNLSRESAMNFMYSNTNDRFGGSKSPRRVTPEGIPVSDRKKIVQKESSVPVVQATSSIASMPIQQQLPERAKSEPKLLNIPSIIEEDESSDDEMMDVVSLDSGTAKMNILAERRLDSSGGTTNTTRHQDTSASTSPLSKSLPCSQPRKNRFAMKNIFGRKKS